MHRIIFHDLDLTMSQHNILSSLAFYIVFHLNLVHSNKRKAESKVTYPLSYFPIYIYNTMAWHVISTVYHK